MAKGEAGGESGFVSRRGEGLSRPVRTLQIPKPNPDQRLPLFSLSRAAASSRIPPITTPTVLFGFSSYLPHLRRSSGFLHARSQVPPPTRRGPRRRLTISSTPPIQSRLADLFHRIPAHPCAPRLPSSSPHRLPQPSSHPRASWLRIAVLDASSSSSGFLAAVAVPQIDLSPFSLHRRVPFAVHSSTVIQSAAHYVVVQSLSSSPLRRALHRRPIRRPLRRSLSLNSDARSLGSPPPPPPSSPPTPTHPPPPSPKEKEKTTLALLLMICSTKCL